MSLKQPEEEHGSPAADSSPVEGVEQNLLPELADAELQEKYRKEYLTQLRRLACPGCGEDFEFF